MVYSAGKGERGTNNQSAGCSKIARVVGRQSASYASYQRRKDAQHKPGDLKQTGFKEIWQDEKYKEFRSQILQGRKNIDICSNCSEGTKAWSD